MATSLDPLTNIRPISGGFEARIVLLTGCGNPNSLSCERKGFAAAAEAVEAHNQPKSPQTSPRSLPHRVKAI
jgi:hypothetical protein